MRIKKVLFMKATATKTEMYSFQRVKTRLCSAEFFANEKC